MTQSIETSFFIVPLTTSNAIYRDLLTSNDQFVSNATIFPFMTIFWLAFLIDFLKVV